MIKKFFLTLSLFIYISLLLAQTNRLEGYQIIAFDGVTRVSLTFTNRPITNVMKEANSLKLTVTIPQCGIGNVPTTFNTNDRFANSIQISTQSRNLIIEINSRQAFAEIKQAGTQSNTYTVHLDIFGTRTPINLPDFTSHLDFYFFTGNRERLDETLRAARETFPNNTQIQNRSQNRFNSPTVYAPRITTPQVITQPTTPRPAQTQTTTARPAQTATQTPSPAPSPPARETTPPPPAAPPPSPPTISPQVPESLHIDHSDISFTLITRHDRFPTRIPQTKPITISRVSEPNLPPITTISQPEPELITEPEPERNITPIPPPEPEPEPEPVFVAVSQPEPEPVTHPLEPPVQRNIEPEHIPPQREVYRAISDTTGLSETERLIISYYHVATVDSILVSFLVGASANIVGDYQNAIRFLSQVPRTDHNYEDAIRLLQNSYLEIGDTYNASFYATLISSNEDISPETDFINTPISLWMALTLGGITLIIGFIIAAISIGAKKSKRKKEIKEDDFSTHISNIQRAYDKNTIETPSKSVEEIEKTDSLSEHYDNPVIITEELTPQETKELIEEEKIEFNYPETKRTEPVVNINKKFEESEYDTFSDDEYIKNLILKLHKDGWKLEEIAKELQISQREIDFIIRING